MRNKSHARMCTNVKKDLSAPMKTISKSSFKEEVEYGAPICLTDSGRYVLGDTVKGERHKVRILARCPVKSKRVGGFHTHPHTKSEFSVEDKLLLLAFPSLNVDCVVAKDGMKCVVIPRTEQDKKWYKQSSNLAYRWLTGKYNLLRIKGRFLELSEPLEQFQCM